MKYTLVTETFPPEINGVAMTLNRLANRLCEEGYAVEVIRPEQKADRQQRLEQPFREYLVMGIPIPGYSIMQIGRFAPGTLKKRWQAERPDVVHIATEGPLGKSAAMAARALGIPFVTSFHTNFHHYLEHYGLGLFEPLMVAYLRSIHNRAPLTLVPSEALMDDLRGHGFTNLTRFSRGTDTRMFSPLKRDPQLRAEWGITDDDAPVSLYVGRMAKEKAIDESIATFRELKQKDPRMEMVCVGEGPELQRLKRAYPDVRFVGAKRGEELARYYASADLFLFASVTETFGNVVTEGLASGLVVLTFDYAAGQLFINNGHNGFLVPFDQPDAFRQQAFAALAKRNEWPAIRQAARETAETIPWEHVFQKYLHDLRTVVQAHDERLAERQTVQV